MYNLATLPLFEDATDDELQWLLAHSHEETLQTGETFFREGEERFAFYVVLEGELQITRTIEGRPTVVGTTPRGIIGGENPLLFGGASAITAQAILPTRLLVLDPPDFRAMFGACPTVAAKVLRISAQRVQGHSQLLQQQEKLAALGKLSAGLAHELNNPAAAARRAAVTLHDALPALQHAALALGHAGLPAVTLATIEALVARVADSAGRPSLSAIERGDREDALASWLEAQGAADAWDLAAAFVEAGLGEDDLALLLPTLPAGTMDVTLSWLHQAISATDLLTTISHSTASISKLVVEVKSYTYMDQGSRQQVDLHKGLESTLIVLGHKLRGITVVRQFDPALPIIEGRGGELNQVWTNLIDNALDAMGGKGTLRLITRCENDFAMVEVADTGAGIPEALQDRVFEPFFTTKEVGVGTGLGLDISYRIIAQHGGSIEVWSEPGNTRFIVRLPSTPTA